MESKRDYRIDLCRGIVMIAVVVGHAAQISKADILSDIIQSFQMAAFMMISGLVFKLDHCDTPGILINKKTRTLLVPYLAWISVRVVLLVCFKNMPLTIWIVLDEVLSSEFWFIRILFVTYCIWAVIIYIWNKAKSSHFRTYVRITMICVIVPLILFLSKYRGLHNLWKHMFFFSVGIALSNYIFHLFKNKLVYIAIGLCLLAMWAISFYVSNINDSLIGMVCDYSSALFGSLAIVLLICKGNMPSKNCAIVKVGQNTLGIYAIHWIVFFATLGKQTDILINAIIANNTLRALFIATIWLLLSYLLTILMGVSNIVSMVFLGSSNHKSDI